MKKITMLVLGFMLFFVFAGCQSQKIDFGIENVCIVEQSEKVKLAENTYGEVFLLAEESTEESGQITTRHLVIMLGDRKIMKALSESYDGDITLCDFDGDEDMEIVLQETVGITGGYGHYLSHVFDLKNGELVELFSSEDETGELFDTGFSLALSGDYRFQIKNNFTGYNETFPFQGKSDEYFELLMQSRFLLVVDSFYEFVPQDVDGDGVYEIKGKQYTSLIGHSDGIGIANTVLKYNKEKATFEVVDAYFSKETEQ